MPDTLTAVALTAVAPDGRAVRCWFPPHQPDVWCAAGPVGRLAPLVVRGGTDDEREALRRRLAGNGYVNVRAEP
jgi:hypothetical protein